MLGIILMNLTQGMSGLLNLQLLTKALSDRQLVGDVTRLTIRKWKWHLGTGNDSFQESKHHYPHDESQ